MSEIYAIYENNVVKNLIVADSKESAEFHSGMKAIKVENNIPQLHWTFSEELGWRPPQPYPSWLWQNNQWNAPIDPPNDLKPKAWNEDLQIWEYIILPQPDPTWEFNEEFGQWVPPQS